MEPSGGADDAVRDEPAATDANATERHIYAWHLIGFSNEEIAEYLRVPLSDVRAVLERSK